MKFKQIDTHIRIFETAHDHCVLPGLSIVARLDGRSFTRLTKESGLFEAPFDEKFRDIMVETCSYLMKESGARILYGYTQSDEISLLFHQEDDTFGRKIRKLNSVLAGMASAKFTKQLGLIGVFDCRISQLPSKQHVVDYFRWRNEDAHRNALNAHTYWMLRKEGKTQRQAASALEGKSVAEKNELLFSRGINFNDLPLWQKRGIGFLWETYSFEGKNHVTNEVTTVHRKRLKSEFELPIKEAYSTFIENIFVGH